MILSSPEYKKLSVIGKLMFWASFWLISGALGGTAIFLYASWQGGGGALTVSQAAVIFLGVGPLAGIPIVLILGAISSRSVVAVAAALAFFASAAYWGFGLGR